MATALPNLPTWINVVDEAGRPTPEFQRWWQESIAQIFEAVITAAQAQQTADDAATDAAGAQESADAAIADAAAANANANARQPADPTLTALAGLDSSAGLVEQTGPDVFAKRALGIADGDDIPTRDDADARYVQQDAGPSFDAATGTATRTAFDTASVTLPDLAERVKAMIDDLKGNGSLS